MSPGLPTAGKKIAPGQRGMSLQGFEGSYFEHLAKVLCSCSNPGRLVQAHSSSAGLSRAPSLQSSVHRWAEHRQCKLCSFLQGITTTLQIPANGFPKQSQMGTQESPAPGKRANLSPVPCQMSFHKGCRLCGRESSWGGGGGEMGMGCRGFILWFF